MKIFKVTDSTEFAGMIDAARRLKAANAAIAAANKEVEACKAHIAGWLKDKRDLALDTLDIGEIVQIDGVIMIERAKQNKFDEKAFAVAQPSVYAANKRDFPMNKFKPLVG